MVAGHKNNPNLQGRRAYATNLRADPEDEGLPITRMWRRLLLLAKFAGYEDVSPTTSAILANLYRDVGDYYAPHCDGECHGKPYKRGDRVATSLTYCRAPARGGATLFTRTGLRVVPKRGQTLFFGYRLNESSAMDDGVTEHCGCPIREGQKWVATMFYFGNK